MELKLIGRKKERAVLQEALNTPEAEMIAVIGRRRVGKTFLIKQAYEGKIIFEITGLQDGDKDKQLANFNFQLDKYFVDSLPLEHADNWLRAFQVLSLLLDKKLASEKGKKVIFFDELPWMDTRKSGFMTGLSFFWNSWAVNKNVVFVVCGSAASWMIKKVVDHKGGLYDRITRRIHLKPFTLFETRQYLESRNILLNNYQIVQLYMAMGGIPHYLKEVKPNKSAVQNIDEICFSETGLLKNEFSRLYPSLFENAENHIAIIIALAGNVNGMVRSKLISAAKLPENGNTSKILEELVLSGFITAYFPYGKKKKDLIYRLTDAYSLFYLKFIENKIHEGSGIWQSLSQTPSFKSWSGYAFENLCLLHIPQIKKAMSIGGVYSISSTFYLPGNDGKKGAQIDLLLDRNDQIINIFEIKFNNNKIKLSKADAENLQNKVWVFQETTKTNKQIFICMITAFGLEQNKYSLGLFNEVLTMDDLFTD